MDGDAAVELRLELCAPAVDSDRIATVSAEIDRIAGLVERDEPATDALAAFNELTGHSYELGDFLHHGESGDLAAFAREAARPAAGRIADITRGELSELVRRIQSAEDDSDYYLQLFEANVPHPRASDLIYWPPQTLANGSWTLASASTPRPSSERAGTKRCDGYPRTGIPKSTHTFPTGCHTRKTRRSKSGLSTYATTSTHRAASCCWKRFDFRLPGIAQPFEPPDPHMLLWPRAVRDSLSREDHLP
jgi:hypothetical protein